MTGAAVAKDFTIVITSEDVQAEHEAAVATLTPTQRRAFARIARAGRDLKGEFALEAEARSFWPANDDR